MIRFLFENQPLYKTRSTPPYINITVDPSGGGMSQLAACAHYFDDQKNLVVSSWPNNVLVLRLLFNVLEDLHNVDFGKA